MNHPQKNASGATTVTTQRSASNSKAIQLTILPTASTTTTKTTSATASIKMGRRYYSSKKKRQNVQLQKQQQQQKQQEEEPRNGDITMMNDMNSGNTIKTANGTMTTLKNSNKTSNHIDPQSYQLWFLESTKNDLIRYLNLYRQGCYEFYNQNYNTVISNNSDDDSIPNASTNGTSSKAKQKNTKTVTKMKINTSIDITNRNGESHRNSNSVIGNIPFPLLNDDLFQQPYMILPYTLSSKQRKIVHDCCLQLNIYHDSVNDSHHDNERVMVLSCYADGFQFLPPQLKEQILSSESMSATTMAGKVLDLHLYQPWYCRRDNNGSSCHNNIVSTMDNESHHSHPDAVTVTAVTETAGTPTKSNRSSSNGHSHEHSHLSTDKVLYTQQMKDKIWMLLDQPGNCIRDTIDTISYEQLHQKSLANYNYQNVKTTTWTLVDTPYKMQQCVQDLQHPDITEIAFDIESYNINAATQITCLIQITSNMKKEYIIDPLAPGVWDEIQQLQSIFGNPRIVKIGHAIASLDVPSLYRDFGIVIVNVFDTYEAAKCIPQIAPYGLAGLCQYYYMPHSDLYQSLKDTYQTCNWRVRPLSPDMMLYGRMDVHYLINLRQLLIRDMVLAYNPLLWKTPLVKVSKVKTTSTASIDRPSTNITTTVNDNVPMKEEIVDELVIVDKEMYDPTTTTTITDKNVHDEVEHTATSIGDDPFLLEVHYNKLIPPTSKSEPILTKNRDVFDFLARISYEEDNYGADSFTSPTSTNTGTTTLDDSGVVDDDDQTTASFNTAIQSLHPKSSSMNGSFNESVNYSSDALYNTCTEEEDEDDILAENENGEEALYAAPKDISPEELRLQPIVMQCISISQERCLNLWNDKKHEENYLNNEAYKSILLKKSSSLSPSPMAVTTKVTKKKKKSTKNQPKMIDIMLPITDSATTSTATIFDKEKDSFTKLYIALVDWRREVASEILECLPGFVVSLDFLVHVAYKRPMTMAGMQLIAQQLPVVLQRNEIIRDSLLDVVIQHTMVFQQLSIPTASIYYYSNLKLEGRMNGTENGTSNSMIGSNALTDTLLVKVLVGGSLSIGFFVSFYDVVQANPQQFNIMPFIEMVQHRMPLYMNHFMEQQVSIVMNSLRSYIPSYFVKK